MFHLVVKQAFGSYARGDVITDQNTIAALMAQGHGRNMLRVPAPAEVAPAPTPEVIVTSGTIYDAEHEHDHEGAQS